MRLSRPSSALVRGSSPQPSSSRLSNSSVTLHLDARHAIKIVLQHVARRHGVSRLALALPWASASLDVNRSSHVATAMAADAARRSLNVTGPCPPARCCPRGAGAEVPPRSPRHRALRRASTIVRSSRSRSRSPITAQRRAGDPQRVGQRYPGPARPQGLYPRHRTYPAQTGQDASRARSERPRRSSGRIAPAAPAELRRAAPAPAEDLAKRS